MTQPAIQPPSTPQDQAMASFRASLVVGAQPDIPRPGTTQPPTNPQLASLILARPPYPDHVIERLTRILYRANEFDDRRFSALPYHTQQHYHRHAIKMIEELWDANIIEHPSQLKFLHDTAIVHTAHNTALAVGVLKPVLRPDHFPLHVLWWGDIEGYR